MSGGKASGKQPEDMILTAAEEALNEPDQGKCEGEDQQAAARKKARTKVRATTVEQPSELDKEKASLDLLFPDRLRETQTPAELNVEGDDTIEAQKLRAAGVFTDALAAVPSDDWCRNWAADRTVMLRMTSKKVQDAVDRLRPPTVVKLNSTFWRRNEAEKNMTELEKMTVWYCIATLDLRSCSMSCQDAKRLGGVLAQCPSLSQLYLDDNKIGAEGAGSLAAVLAQCPALSVLSLGGLSGFQWHHECNEIGNEGAERFAGVLPQCPALSALYLGGTGIGDEGVGRLAEVLPQCPALSVLCLCENDIGPQGALELAGVLPQCPALSKLDLGWNNIGNLGTEILAVVLPQCLALSRLELCVNYIGQVGVGRLADVLPRCPALSHLSLGGNPLGDQGGRRLAGVLPQCKALSELNLQGCFGYCFGDELPGDELAGIFAEVLPQCPVLSLFELGDNQFSAEGKRRIQASWCGPHQLRMLADCHGLPGGLSF